MANIEQWSDPKWRINNLYWILSDDGEKIRFEMNEEQNDFYDAQWYLNLILKARQLGFTTLICIIALDCCVFNKNFSAGIIAHNLEDAKKIFRRKVKFAYDNLPNEIKRVSPLSFDNGSQLGFKNGSEITVSTSYRSGTLQLLHVSEFGKICRQYPEKANEIVTGAFNAVHEGQIIYIESTAEGRSGHFFEMCKTAKDMEDMSKKLTTMDFKLHFYPWYKKKSYAIVADDVVIPKEHEDYFKKLESESGVFLSNEQKAWYVKKAATQGEKMKREFPSTPEEAFEQAIIGSYYGSIIAKMRAQGRIRRVPHTHGMPVNTFWDLGRNDLTAIWLHQYVAGEHRFIGYYENSGEGLSHYFSYLDDLRVNHGYVYGRHYLPHDADNKNLEHNQSRVERLEELGMINIEVVERIENVNDGIEMVRRVLPTVWIDEVNCGKGIVCLEQYQKQWDDRQGTFKERPLHNHASNGADSFRQFAQVFDNLAVKKQIYKPKRRGGMSI